ncbi:MAG TPA: DEAD/DEAH box helicase [Saprospiraceae bacterium]|nr:DEAD/DEAH box helicase [Saprospiraceae bacterium]HPI06142.1 DEAD/DEAH box helicase [Saprospiraceae bacterium]
MADTFESLNLTNALQDALKDIGYTHPTPIQQKAFSVVLSGRDVVGIAQTGTGKTYAYLLPILRNMKFSKEKDPRVLIVVPTRELVLQMVSDIEKLTKYMTVRVAGIYGGTNINTQAKAMATGTDILVATPGRLLDLVFNRAIILKSVRQLVIDEVDEMLNLGFRGQLSSLLDLIPKKRQNLLFSATMTEDVDELIDIFFNAPELIEVMRAGTPLEKIKQSAYRAPNYFSKLNLLEYLLKHDESMEKVLIFGATKRMADRIFEFLESKFPGQFSVTHSNKSQNFRMQAIQKFQDGMLRGLVSTDLLARGLDVTDITHVINVDTPDTPENYIHRIGRTGRADSEGAAVTFVSDAETEYRTQIETLMGKPIPELPLPDESIISLQLTEEEKEAQYSGKNYMKSATLIRSQGAFHEKLEKNKKVNLGNATKHRREMKYKKPIKRRPKKKGGDK